MPHRSILSVLPQQDGKYSMPLGKIRIERPLKQGQLTEVLLAFHEGLQIPIILRVMKPEIKAQLGEQGIQDLVEGCRQYAKVRHSSVTAIYDVGWVEDFGYAAIEYVAGVPLNERIHDRPLTEEQALNLMGPIADGLAALWKNDYIHRGVSPLRIIIDNEGVSKLDMVVLPRRPLKPVLIEAHAPFMAGFWPPEELRQSAGIDSRSDMFSFGASLYYAVTGQTPFGNGSRTELMARTLTENPVEPRQLAPALSERLNEFLMRCLQRDPKNRFDSTQGFSNALAGLKSCCCPPTERPSSFTLLSVAETEVPETATFAEGDVVDQCRLGPRIGSGSFGVVHKAQHQLLDIPVAVKFLPREMATRNPEYVDMFLREARTAIRIRHKHIIGLYGAGQQGGQYYLVMEYAPGGTVQEYADLTQGKLAPPKLTRILRETALGLNAAEEMGIVHRDIKPTNLMFGAQREIKIADLGLAKRLPRPSGMDGAIKASIRAEQLTLKRGDSMIMGTAAYMAPEAALTPEAVDWRADLYSLGVTAYQLLTGRLPFDGEEELQVIMKHITQPIPPFTKADAVPKKLEIIVLRLMSKKVEERYQSANQLLAALDALPAELKSL